MTEQEITSLPKDVFLMVAKGKKAEEKTDNSITPPARGGHKAFLALYTLS